MRKQGADFQEVRAEFGGVVKSISKSRKGVVGGIAAVAMLLAMSVPGWAQPQMSRDGSTWVETDSGTLPSAKTLRVSADVGSVTVETGGQAFRYTVRKRSFSSNEQEAKRLFENIRISTGREGDGVTLRLTGGGAMHGRFSTEIVVNVPREMETIKVDTRAGNIAVKSTTADVLLTTMGGNIYVDDSGDLRTDTMGGNTIIKNVSGDARVRSAGGNVSIGNVKGDLNLDTQGGNVDVNTISEGVLRTGGGCVTLSRSNGDVVVNTGGGTIQLGEIMGSAKAQTGGGNIRIGMSKGPVIASTGGGNIELWKVYRGAQVQTGAGAITVEFLGGKGAFSDSYLHTAAGDVVVYLSSGFSGSVRASSELASGRGISTDFPELVVHSEGGDYGPKTMFAEGSLNGGGPMLKVRTTIGQIAFRRSK